MTKNPLTVGPKMSVASVAHMMIWESIEVIPVVKDDLTLIGIVSRQDILKSMQMIQNNRKSVKRLMIRLPTSFLKSRYWRRGGLRI